MRKLWISLILGVLPALFFALNLKKSEARITFSKNFETTTSSRLLSPINQSLSVSQIKDIQIFGEKSGIAYTDEALFRTDDDGKNWREIVLPRASSETISRVSFFNENTALAILADQQTAYLELAKTNDGGESWSKTLLNLSREDLAEADLGRVELNVLTDRTWQLKIKLSSSSNFSREVLYETGDGGANWESKLKYMEKRISENSLQEKLFAENIIAKSRVNDRYWVLTSNGVCEKSKTDCFQETKIRTEFDEITPPQIKQLAQIDKENAQRRTENSIFANASAPNGSTRISLNRGFDKCTAAPVSQMQIWWDASPFYDSNIYIGGNNRGCTQPQLTRDWVNQVAAQGWGLIPTWVGPQAPCTTCTRCSTHSSDTAIAETEGRAQADLAIAAADNLGLTQGTIIYYDMERYADTGCGESVKSFLKGWTDRLKEQGYKSGAYGSPFNANIDWRNIPAQSQMEAIWLARWNNVMSVWGVDPLPDSLWANHQRIHQWVGPRDETWGGITFNIDNNISDAPVAGTQTKNAPADFDGDGKTDISVWRPDTGAWYVINSSNSTYTIISFGASTDVLTPRDYDGDGRTDFGVWRSDGGVWHIYSRSIYRALSFGASGDIPAPADFDGDGRTDLAVYRPASGTWYISNSFDSRGTSFRIESFGLDGDKPVPGDYDGDGRADIGVYRPSNGVWYISKSTGGYLIVSMGNATDMPVPSDYDGDGKIDLAVYRNGTWYILQSRDGLLITQFGAEADKPAAGDYDGDGKSDLAVFRPSTGVWYVRRSSDGSFIILQFGVSTDLPVPAAYFPRN